MSWVTDWAEKGGNFLNSLDTRVADLLNTNEPSKTNLIPPLRPQASVAPSQHIRPLDSESVHTKPPSLGSNLRDSSSKRENMVLQPNIDREAELFEFLNNSTPLESISISSSQMQQASSTLTDTARQLDYELNPSTQIKVPNLDHKDELSPHLAQPTPTVNSENLILENQLLHSEVSSLNNEISNLISRYRKSEEDSRTQIELLTKQMDECKSKLLQMESATSVSDSSKQNRVLSSKIELLSNNLKLAQSALIQSEKKAAETLRLAELSRSRADQAQSEASRVSRSLAEYKEKASNILSAKEKVILELQKQLLSVPGASTDGTTEQQSTVQSLREELALLREEERGWRLEAENRELAFREFEEQMQVEQVSLRRTIDVLEQQRERDRQICADADKEIISLQNKLNSQEERIIREKSELHSIIQSNEVELARMRRLVAERRSGSSSLDSSSVTRISAPPPRSDSEQILALESRIRQLNDSLLTKQDALDATLAQNHGLKIRLARFEAENEVHLLSSERQAFTNGHPQLLSPNRSASGFARLYLVETSLPGYLRNSITTLDELMIKLVSFLRRRPLFRLLFIFYLLLVHLWFLSAFFVFSSPLPSADPVHSIPL